MYLFLVDDLVTACRSVFEFSKFPDLLNMMAVQQPHTEVNNTLSQLVDINPVIDNNFKALKEMAENIKSIVKGDDSLIAEEVERLREICRNLVITKLKASKVRDALEYSKDQAVHSKEKSDEEVESIFVAKRNEEMTQLQNELTQLIKIDTDYRSFESHLRKLGLIKERLFQARSGRQADTNDDEDIVVAGGHEVFKDPFSQIQIEDAVRNKHCGHMFERGTVAEMLKQAKASRRKLMCPYLGCSNKNAIVEADLEDVED